MNILLVLYIYHKLVVGGLSGREAVAAYQYNEAIYWVYLYGN